MDIRENITDELSGDGMIMIDGRDVAIVPYSLAPTISPLIAEGSISGPEPLLKRVKRSREVKLALANGSIVAIRCGGGRNGTRWVKATRV